MSANADDVPAGILDLFEVYETTLQRDPTCVPALIGGFIASSAACIESLGYDREDIIDALLGVASQMMATDKSGTAQELAEGAQEAVRINIEFHRLCPDGVGPLQ